MTENQGNIAENAFKRHQEVITKSLETILPNIQKGSEVLLSVVQSDGLMLTCGNGGSAADAQHLSGEWLCRYKSNRKPLRAIALSTDTSTITAIGNDYRFEDIFKRQIEALGRKSDVLVAFTTSGQSPNILAAINQARNQGLKVIVLTGERGAGLRDKVDVAIVVPDIETARIQEIHELVLHIWCEYIDAHLKND